MEKRAVVEVGVTPSVHSGKPSESLKDGEAVCENEMNKKASFKLEETDNQTIKDEE